MCRQRIINNIVSEQKLMDAMGNKLILGKSSEQKSIDIKGDEQKLILGKKKINKLVSIDNKSIKFICDKCQIADQSYNCSNCVGKLSGHWKMEELIDADQIILRNIQCYNLSKLDFRQINNLSSLVMSVDCNPDKLQTVVDPSYFPPSLINLDLYSQVPFTYTTIQEFLDQILLSSPMLNCLSLSFAYLIRCDCKVVDLEHYNKLINLDHGNKAVNLDHGSKVINLDHGGKVINLDHGNKVFNSITHIPNSDLKLLNIMEPEYKKFYNYSGIVTRVLSSRFKFKDIYGCQKNRMTFGDGCDTCRHARIMFYNKISGDNKDNNYNCESLNKTINKFIPQLKHLKQLNLYVEPDFKYSRSNCSMLLNRILPHHEVECIQMIHGRKMAIRKTSLLSIKLKHKYDANTIANYLTMIPLVICPIIYDYV